MKLVKMYKIYLYIFKYNILPIVLNFFSNADDNIQNDLLSTDFKIEKVSSAFLNFNFNILNQLIIIFIFYKRLIEFIRNL